MQIQYIDNPHSYIVNGITVPSPSTLFGNTGGGVQSIKGHEFHEYLHNYAQTGDKNYLKEIIAIDKARLKEEQIGAEGLITNLGKLLHREKLKFVTTEFKIANCITYNNVPYFYAGMLDCLCARLNENGKVDLFVLDYKSGKGRDKDCNFQHTKQLVMYMGGIRYLLEIKYETLLSKLQEKGFNVKSIDDINTIYGVVIYNNEIKQISENCAFVLDSNAKEFVYVSTINEEITKLLVAYHGKLEGFTWRKNGKVYANNEALKPYTKEITDLLKEQKFLQKELEESSILLKLKDIESKIKELKEEITPLLTENGYTDDNIFIYYNKPKKLIKLRKEIEEQLRKEHLEYFDISEGKSSFTFKLMNN